MVAVDFYLGLGSRYSYLAASQVERIEAGYGCRFIWKPIGSGALIDRRRDNPFRAPAGSGQYAAAYRHYDARSWAAHFTEASFRSTLKHRVFSSPVSGEVPLSSGAEGERCHPAWRRAMSRSKAASSPLSPSVTV